MACYLPNWLIESKHLAHTESSSNLAVLIPALLVIVVQREGWSTGEDERGGGVTRTGNYFPTCIAATSLLAFATTFLHVYEAKDEVVRKDCAESRFFET